MMKALARRPWVSFAICPSHLSRLGRRQWAESQSPRLGYKRQARTTTESDADNSGDESQPVALDDYYQLLLNQPLHKATSATRTSPQSPPPHSLPKTDREERLAKARVVFGSRLAGPASRRSEIDRASTRIAGVLVPPRPAEPDNCCMSGCANCVWDRYRDELEEWAAKSAHARANLQRSRERGQGTGLVEGPGAGGATHTALSMDDDGGGSDTNWGTGLDSLRSGDDLFKGVPVGILEFMRTEKKLKERHMREGTVRG